MNENIQALSTIVERSNIDLAISGWLDEHKKSKRTHKAYQDAIEQFRAGLQRAGRDLDTDVQTLMLAAQAFARGSKNKEQVSELAPGYSQQFFRLCHVAESAYADGQCRACPQPDQGY